MDKAQQELFFKLSMFEQQIQNIQQQLNVVEKSILDMNSLNTDLGEIEGANGKDILCSIGSGIFAKAKLISEDLIVNIGEKYLVKKSIRETQEIIQNQIKKLEGVKEELNKALEEINKNLTESMLDHQKKNS